jgi:hypothetical protein
MRYHLGKALLEAGERMDSDIMRKKRETRVYFTKLPGTFISLQRIQCIKVDDAVPYPPQTMAYTHVYSLKG